jgi:hypothetical protein
MKVHALSIFRVKMGLWVCTGLCFQGTMGSRSRRTPVVVSCYGSVLGSGNYHLTEFFIIHHPSRQHTNWPTNQPAHPNKLQTYRSRPLQYFIMYGWLNCLIASIMASQHATTILKGRVISKSKKVMRYPCNRPWRPIGLWDVKDPTLSRQSAYRWRQGCQSYAPATLYIPETLLFLCFWYSFLLEAE